jgi:peptide-methionine (S)-S-oxide reductase
MLFARKKTEMPTAETALKGRPTPLPTAEEHFIFGRPVKGPYPAGLETAVFGLGCFWGAERKFWQLGAGVWATAVGYAGGFTPTRPMTRSAPGEPGTTRWCSSCSIPR